MNNELKELAKRTRILNNLSDSQLESFSKTLTWTSFGITGRAKPRTQKLIDLEPDHIENILVNLNHVSPTMKKIMFWVYKKKIGHEHFSR